MEDCLFCKIGREEIPSYLLYEDAVVLAFLDMHPHAPGHAMIIPKIHAENILDLPKTQVQPLFSAVQKVTRMIEKTLQPSGFTIGINHGRVSGQAVDHLHVHIIPRFDGDGGASLHSVVTNPPKESLEVIKNKIISSES